MQHDLAHEFPEMKDAIHALKTTDTHFKKLFEEYEDIAKELENAEEGAGGISDAHAEELKKKRLELKDQLYGMLKKEEPKKEGSCGNCGCS
ncbi:MAG: DUF465 domain-containing protein [Alphaproteobacteria bacterium]|nr:DUF465 domain-containing protein [Alphaproteobacteria bacterium]